MPGTKKEEKEYSYLNISIKKELSNAVQSNPNAVFIVEKKQTYSWDEIDKCAQIIASDLSGLGVKKGSHVGIVSGNSSNWILTFFAVQKLGAIACLLNPHYTEKEIVEVARLGDITVMCCGDLAARTPALFDHLTHMEESPIQSCYDMRREINYKERLSEYEAVSGLFDFAVEPDDICTMIYTSGSTGKPKGVLLSAYNILNAAYFTEKNLAMTATDSLCLILPLFHIFGLVAGLFSAALSLGKLVIPEDMHTDTLLDTIAENRCTVFHAVPTMLLALIGNADFTKDKVSSIRATIISGASATEKQMIKFKEQFPNTRFLSSYGLSEMAPVSVTMLNDSKEHVLYTVGKPLDTIRFKVTDPQSGADCDDGQIGEILVRGFNSMLCYYKMSLDDQAADGDGWIHTGDLGFMDEDGYLHLSGRIKELIIRGGENIMPLEVASVIAQNPDVCDVKVIGVPDFFFGEIVCACLIMNAGCTFDKERMNVFLADRLAKFKIPSMYMIYDHFPLLSNGKVDAVTLRKEATLKQETGLH